MKNKYIVTGLVSEMSADAGGNVPVSSKVDVSKLTDGDEHPMFVTVEVMNPQVSSNKRRWTPEIMSSIAEQINDKLPDGYMGHIKPENHGTEMPESQTMWIGAKIVDVDGVPRLVAKGYIFPYAEKLRSYLKKAINAGKKVAVSVYGNALQMWNKVDKLYDIKDFDLESIDWTRSGSAAVKPALVPVITSEQDDPNMKTKEEILAELTLEELKQARPDLLDALKEELKKETPESTPPTPEPQVKEMKSLLGIEDDRSVVSEMKVREDERLKLLDSYMDSKIKESVGRDSLRPVFKRMIVSEMKANSIESIDNAVLAVLQSEEGKTLLAEMTKEPKVDDPQDNRNSGGRKYTKLS